MNRMLSAAAAVAGLAAATPALALNVCVEGAYPPFSETAADGSIVGFDIDIANALCAEIGETCAMVKVDWDGIIPALLEKKCDAIVASMSITAERKQVIDFTAKYYQTPARFAAAEDADLDRPPRAWPARPSACSAAPSTRRSWRRTSPTADLRALRHPGRDGARPHRRPPRRGDGRQHRALRRLPQDRRRQGLRLPRRAAVDPAIHGEGAGIGVRKEDTELRDKLTAAIDAIRADGKYDAIAGKYFDFDVYGATELTRAGAARAGMENLIRYAPLLAEGRW